MWPWFSYTSKNNFQCIFIASPCVLNKNNKNTNKKKITFDLLICLSCQLFKLVIQWLQLPILKQRDSGTEFPNVTASKSKFMCSGLANEEEEKEKRIDLCRRSDVWSERFAFEFEQKTAKLSNGGAVPHVQRSLNLEETIICNLSHLRTQKHRVAWDNITVGFGKSCFIRLLIFFKVRSKLSLKTFSLTNKSKKKKKSLVVSWFFSLGFLWTHLAIPHMIDCLEWV